LTNAETAEADARAALVPLNDDLVIKTYLKKVQTDAKTA